MQVSKRYAVMLTIMAVVCGLSAVLTYPEVAAASAPGEAASAVGGTVGTVGTVESSPEPGATRLIVTTRTQGRGPLASTASAAALATSADSIAAAVDGSVQSIIGPSTFSLDVPSAQVDEVRHELEALRGVRAVQSDHVYRALLVPNDPCVLKCPFALPEQWGLAKINAAQAWDVSTGDPGVLVAVLDTGVSVTNADLVGKVITGPTYAPSAFLPACGANAPVDHGTHVAGIVAAATNNGFGVAGLGWNTRVLSIKVLDDYGCGNDSTVTKGIYAAADTAGVRVINLSLGGACDGLKVDPCPSPALQAAITYAQSKNIVVVAAAGNGDGESGVTTPTYPAAFDKVVAVAASDPSDNLAGFSNYGPWVDIAAPGVGITSTYMGTYASGEGTSAAAPYVAATAALIFASAPTSSADAVIGRIYTNADYITGTGSKIVHGRLDTGGALANPPRGYWQVGLDGGVFSFGTAQFFGSTGAMKLNQPIVGIAATPSGLGYWLVARDGGIFSFGDARFFGSTGAMKLNQPIVGIAATPSGLGYWLVARDGGIFSFGDATFYGSMGATTLNQPIVGISPTPSGKGYRMVAGDGGIFGFGDAMFMGSTGALKLAQPIVGMATTISGAGYWLVARDGGIFGFGDAPFFGSSGGAVGSLPVVGMAVTPSGAGYWLLRLDGTVDAFGDAPNLGKATVGTFAIGIADRP